MPTAIIAINPIVKVNPDIYNYFFKILLPTRANAQVANTPKQKETKFIIP